MTELLGQLDPFELAARYGIPFLRISALLFFLPVLGSLRVPVRIRVVFALALMIAVAPTISPAPTAPPTLFGWALLAAREIAIGLSFGIAARTIFAVVENAAGIIAGQSGFAIASMVDPSTGDQGLVTSVFANVFMLALFLAADLHHLLILAIHESFALIPPAATLPNLAALGDFAPDLGVRMFRITAELVGPGLLISFAGDLLLALVGRALSQVPILMVGYPVKLALGLVALAVLVVGTGSAIGSIGRTIVEDGRVVMSALAEPR